jgi:hypothetical protein
LAEQHKILQLAQAWHGAKHMGLRRRNFKSLGWQALIFRTPA